MQDRLDPVLRQSQDRRKELQEFVFAIQKRVETEDMYARNIDATGKLLDRFIQEKNCISLTYAAFKADHGHRAEQSRVFAQSLKDEVLNMLRDVLNSQNGECKKLEKDARKFQKEIQMHLETLSKAKQRYTISDRKRQQQQIINEIAKLSSEVTTDKKQKQNSFTKDIEKETKEYQQVYRMAMKEYNDYLELYNTEMRKILTRYQEHEELRIERQVDSIMKILVYETSMMRNFDYDITNISRQMEGVKADADIAAFIQNNRTTNPKLVSEVQPPNNTFLNITITRIINKAFDSKLQLFENNKSIRAYISSLTKGGELAKQLTLTPSEQQDTNKIFNVISTCWKVRPLQPDELSSIRQLTINDRYRHLFAMLFKQYSVHIGLELSPAGYENAAVLFQIALDRCSQARDVFVGRKLLAMMFSLWTQDKMENGKTELSNTRQKLLSVRLQHLQIWRVNQFWESAIFQSVQEELKTALGQKGETLQEAIVREKNVIFGQLAFYCHYMLMLGNSSKTVRQVVGKYCRFYQLSEDQSKDLSKAINSTSKQYREMYGGSVKTDSSMDDSKLG